MSRMLRSTIRKECPNAQQKPPAAVCMMPSHSEKQRRFMAAAAHDPQFAKSAGIPQSVAREYNQADKGKKLGEMLKHVRKK